MFTRNQWLDLYTKNPSLKGMKRATHLSGTKLVEQILLDWTSDAHKAADEPLKAMVAFAAEHPTAESSARNVELVTALCTITDSVEREENA